ncbi:hypothetical protein [Vibrio campbellii]|uniref:hypothetical protein n=1 Tax=Vibrio campbellii TaxID=680 RepID=UPI0005EE66F7|nr:hypothetical protein [Vibrio campbellii]
MNINEKKKKLKKYNIITSHDISRVTHELNYRQETSTRALLTKEFKKIYYIEVYDGYRKVRTAWYKDTTLTEVKRFIKKSSGSTAVYFHK